MRHHYFVISDLHLGGGPGFQMCTAAGRTRLASFIRGVTAQHGPQDDAHLVVAGDIVDFLAEPPFLPFTACDSDASGKLARILKDTDDVWAALAAHVAAGAPLTLMLGNHDIELSLPGPRRLLMERLGMGRVEFLYDNQALGTGPLLVEHGNRYDGWNVVNHDTLREVRSSLSRREAPPDPGFQPMPGSQLVVQLMNPLKAKYSFIDLLKPEDATVPPLLGVLEPTAIGSLTQIYALARQGLAARQHTFDEKRGWSRGIDDLALEAVPSPAGPAAQIGRDEALQRLTQELATIPDVGEDGNRDLGAVLDFASLWEAARFSPDQRNQVLLRLRRALLAYAGDNRRAFDVTQEEETYLKPARASAGRGFQVIVYGHTHLVKRVDLGSARYLNSGTWADLMRLPDIVLKADAKHEEALQQLGAFADDLAHNRLDSWRHQVPTFARIDLAEDLSLKHADVYLFSDDKGAQPVPDGPFATW